MILWCHSVEVFFHTTTKDKLLFPINYSKFSYLCIQTPLLFIFSLFPFITIETLSLPKLSPPLKMCSHETLSSIEVVLPRNSLIHWRSELPSWRHDLMFEGVCVGLMFERVHFTERAFDIWRFGFSLDLGMVSRREDLIFEIVGFIVLGNKTCWVWYLWGFEWFLFCLEIELLAD